MSDQFDLKEIKALIEAQNVAFKAHQDRLDAVEKKGEEALDKAAFEKIDTAINDATAQIKALEAKMNRPGKSEDGAAASEHKTAFSNFVRKGEEAGLAELEAKAMSIGTGADGGFAVPEELDRTITELQRDTQPMRELSTVIPVSTEGWKKLVNLGGTGSGWVGETDVRTETSTPSLAEVAPPMGEIYANAAVSQRALDDVFFNVEQFLAQEVAREFNEKEGASFISGDGVNKPKGLTTYTTALTGDDTRAFGTMQHFATGVAADLPATAADTEDMLLDLVFGVKSGHRMNASWLFNSTVTNRLRKLRDADGHALWQPSLQAGDPATFLGYRYTVDENMADIAANALPVAFGDFAACYYVLDRIGTRMLRDPYTNKPNVMFYTTKRVGGGVVNSEAVKFIKVAA